MKPSFYVFFTAGLVCAVSAAIALVTQPKGFDAMATIFAVKAIIFFFTSLIVGRTKK